MKKVGLILLTILGVVLLLCQNLIFIEMDNTIAYGAVEQLKDADYSKFTVSHNKWMSNIKNIYTPVCYSLIVLPLLFIFTTRK